MREPVRDDATMAGVSILVVEDDSSLAQVIAWSLEERGYVVERATSVEQARERLRRLPAVSLVISDVRLPKRSGTDLLPSPGGRPDPPVLMMTAFGSLALRELVEARGAALLDKPFSLDVLHRHVEALLAARAP